MIEQRLGNKNAVQQSMVQHRGGHDTGGSDVPRRYCHHAFEGRAHFQLQVESFRRLVELEAGHRGPPCDLTLSRKRVKRSKLWEAAKETHPANFASWAFVFSFGRFLRLHSSAVTQ